MSQWDLPFSNSKLLRLNLTSNFADLEGLYPEPEKFKNQFWCKKDSLYRLLISLLEYRKQSQ